MAFKPMRQRNGPAGGTVWPHQFEALILIDQMQTWKFALNLDRNSLSQFAKDENKER